MHNHVQPASAAGEVVSKTAFCQLELTNQLCTFDSSTFHSPIISFSSPFSPLAVLHTHIHRHSFFTLPLSPSLLFSHYSIIFDSVNCSLFLSACSVSVTVHHFPPFTWLFSDCNVPETTVFLKFPHDQKWRILQAIKQIILIWQSFNIITFLATHMLQGLHRAPFLSVFTIPAIQLWVVALASTLNVSVTNLSRFLLHPTYSFHVSTLDVQAQTA